MEWIHLDQFMVKRRALVYKAMKPSGSVKGEERLDFVSDHLRKKFSVPRCKLAS
jgi:hypothetical protein